MNSEEEIAFMQPFIDEMSSMRVLDIGCGDGSLLANIYDRYSDKILKVTGVDNESEKLDEEGLWTEVNGRGIKYIPEEKREFYLGDGIEFLNGLNIPQSLIIFSNILHFYTIDKAMEILETALSKLAPGGIIYVKVANDNHQYRNTPGRFLWDDRTIAMIESKWVIKIKKKREKHDELILTNDHIL